MAVAPDDLKAPVGPVDAKLFPGIASTALSDILAAYIANAEQEPAVLAAPADRQDPMVRSHALYQAFTAVYIRMSAEPMTVTVTEKGGHGYSVEQIKNMRALADKYLSDFNALIILPGTSRPGITPGSVSVPTSVRW
jgi:hypothetical protein